MFGPTTSVTLAGSRSFSYVDVACPAYAALSGFTVDADTWVGGIPHVFCKAITKANGRLSLSDSAQDMGGFEESAGTTHDLSCPSGSVISGADGWTGAWLDQIQFGEELFLASFFLTNSTVRIRLHERY